MTAEVAPAVGGAVRRVNVQHGGFLGGCLSGTEAVLAFWVRLEHLIAHADKDVGFRAGGQLLIITLEKIAVASAINDQLAIEVAGCSCDLGEQGGAFLTPVCREAA